MLLVVHWQVLFLFVMGFAWVAEIALVVLVPERKITRPPFRLRVT